MLGSGKPNRIVAKFSLRIETVKQIIKLTSGILLFIFLLELKVLESTMIEAMKNESLENNNTEIQEIYDKFSDRLVKKILSVSENGKNTDALKIINKIFTDD